MSTHTPKHAVLLTRISDARNGDARGVTDQEADERKLCKRLGWGVGEVITENDISAFKRQKIQLPNGRTVLRTVRPGFRRALDLLASGEADALVAYDLDRVCRDPRDLEDLIDVVESRPVRIPVESVSGSLRLGTDADITMARVMVAVGNKASRDTGRRVARARLRQAEAGAYSGGRRAYGYDADGIRVRQDEKDEVKAMADALLSGTSLRQVVLDLRKRDVPTVVGATCRWPRPADHDDEACKGCRYKGVWSTATVRDVLLRPRNAGISTYKGEEVGAGEWPAILDEDEWRAVVALLSDESRRTTTGNQVQWLGSGLYRCGKCGAIMRVSQSGDHRRRAYRCDESMHVVRVAESLDKAVQALIVARLSEPDALAVVAKPRRPDVDAKAVQRTVAKLDRRLREVNAEMSDPDGRPVTTLRKAADDLSTRIAAEQAKLLPPAGDPLAPFAVPGGVDAAEVWVGLDLDRQRAILRTLCTIVVKPCQVRGRKPGAVRQADGSFGSYFDPNSIAVEWRTGPVQ